ncbi:MAG: hypothetical protein A2W91_10415 [Bacteroidetes bacterium GWF2_38_335]|nr:MAG: hypothetical protein A2W91_10415 [Bacteroidetes bacterium GWF2_38_335]OFY81883.1 MAG: hypothetical protein A2281_06625 [Bacteroidetes bacterium RIFOXYA12_FULL_38_20]HBS87960.1 hypothetical protein [Bacteroidales bacterium]
MKKILFLLFGTFCLSGLYSQQTWKNLIFEGAGVRGIAYCGVLSVLEEKGVMGKIENVGGTSAGAITALMVSLGYTSNEIEKIISETKFQKFNDGAYIFIGGIYRTTHKYGWYKPDAFLSWLDKIILDKCGNSEITFAELSQMGFKNLYVTATCLNKQKLVVFSHQNYPEMKVKDAVRISMSIPLYFEAVFVDEKGKTYEKQSKDCSLDVMVDGGILGNFPIFIFDSIYSENGRLIRIPDYSTIGIRIDTKNQIASDAETKELVPLEIKSVSDYVNAFYIIAIENLNRSTLEQFDWERTISVSSEGIASKIRKLSEHEKKLLIESGQKFATDFLE